MSYQTKIKLLLEDLYAIDSSLKAYEGELKKIIHQLLKMKPAIEFDEKFKEKLKSEILTRINEIKEQKERKPGLARLFSFGAPAYVLAGGLAVVCVIIGSLYFLQKESIPVTKLDGRVRIVSSLESNAFGRLISSDVNPPAEAGKGMGSGAASLDSPAATELSKESAGIGGGGGQELGMPAPRWVSYKYVYDGEEFAIENQSIDVLRRQKDIEANPALTALAKEINFGLLSLTGFAGSGVDNLNLIQKQDYGYYISINFSEGMISIYKNWLAWPDPYACFGTSNVQCREYQPIKISDLPSDEKLIKIANDFVKKHNVNLAAYGSPEVNKEWLNYIDQPMGEAAFAPEEIQIVYPLMINGKKVYESYGSLSGISVSVDVRNQKVSALYNLSTQNYESSAYKTASTEDVLKVAENGGINFYPYYGNDQDVVEVKLGTPTKGYAKHWKHNSSGRSDELIVPALIFPIKEMPQERGYHIREQIVVPLADELIQEHLNNLNQDQPVHILEQR